MTHPAAFRPPPEEPTKANAPPLRIFLAALELNALSFTPEVLLPFVMEVSDFLLDSSLEADTDLLLGGNVGWS